MKRLIPLFLIVLTLLAVSCNPEAKKDETCTVTFMNGDTTYKTVTVKAGEKVAEPEEPSDGDKEFAAWITDEKMMYDFDEEVNESITLTAAYFKEMTKDQSAAMTVMMELCSLLYDETAFDSVPDSTWQQLLFMGTCAANVDENNEYYYLNKNKSGEEEDTSKYYYFTDSSDSSRKYVFIDVDKTKTKCSDFKATAAPSTEVEGAVNTMVTLKGLEVDGKFSEGEYSTTEKKIVKKTESPAFADVHYSINNITGMIITSTYVTEGEGEDAVKTPLMLNLITKSNEGEFVLYMQTNAIKTDEATQTTSAVVTQVLEVGADFYKNVTTTPIPAGGNSTPAK